MLCFCNLQCQGGIVEFSFVTLATRQLHEKRDLLAEAFCKFKGVPLQDNFLKLLKTLSFFFINFIMIYKLETTMYDNNNDMDIYGGIFLFYEPLIYFNFFFLDDYTWVDNMEVELKRDVDGNSQQ